MNYVTGAAIINRPIYVGDGYPLIPDFEDMKMKPKGDPEPAPIGPSEP